MKTTHCTCGHQGEAHDHYRRGTDCAICGATACPRFRVARGARARAAALPAPLPPVVARETVDA